MTGGPFPIARIAAAFLVLSLAPLVLLTYFSIERSTDVVKKEVNARLAATASTSAEAIHAELEGLSDLVDSYAQRPSVVDLLAEPTSSRAKRQRLRSQLRELRRRRAGIYTAFFARRDGTLIDIVPATPSIVGKNFSFRDWYLGVTATGLPYLSEVYRTQAAGHPLVTAAAAPVHDRDGHLVGILVAAYSLQHMRDLSAELAATQKDIELGVTDQRGVLVAGPDVAEKGVVSHRDDPDVEAALGGLSGTLEATRPGNQRELVAYAPVRDFGWAVTAAVPANKAFAAVDRLRTAVLTVATILALVLLGGLVLLVRNLQGRRRAEEEARHFASINRAVLDATPDGICLIEEGKLAVANAAMRKVAELHGLEPEGDLAELASVVRDRTTDPEEYWRVMRTILSDPELESVYDYELIDGRSFRRYTAPVRLADGSIMGRIISLRETTSEREAERMKSELVATVSHELRTPLASIVGFAELLVDRQLDEEKRARYAGTIHSEAKRLTALINKFLDLQRIEEGRFTLALEPVELVDVVHEEIETMRGQSTKHVIELVESEEAVDVLGERDRIAQVLVNLLSNAVKYSPAGGRVEARIERREAVVRVSISDEGLGIPTDQQRLLFTKFFRVDSSDTREIGGTGLGLALCREIVEAHGGRIGFDSTEGEGSTFWFELPLPYHGNGKSSRRVLVIEDDPAASSLLAEYIGGDGYVVEVAASGEQGLARAIEDPPGLICIDIGLPGDIDGWQLLARLRERPDTADIPVVICSGRNGRDRAAALGVTDFVTKPFSQRQIKSAVERALPEGRGSVLVVDDDPAVRRLVFETLQGEGMELRGAADGETALVEIAAEKPDALILDLMMPGLDGFHVLEQLQASDETRLLPVIVLTARQLSSNERARLRDRTVSLLEKSAYSPQELRRLVNRLLAGPAE